MSPRIFLLSPANCRGRRAQQVMAAHAAFPVAVQLRSKPGVPIGELFAFLSVLYFRGKLTYARRFAQTPTEIRCGALVITPHRGLVPIDIPLTLDALQEFGDVDISERNPAYRTPLETSATALLSKIGPGTDVVLLGSVASDKYVSILGGIFGSRLLFPSAFVGRGDMSRGGLLLRAAAAGHELEYVPVLGSTRRGARPPKLAALQVQSSRCKVENKL